MTFKASFGFKLLHLLIFLAIAGCLKKLSFEEGWEFFPNLEGKHQSGGIQISKHDFTLTPVGEKGWTTGKD